MIVFNLLAPAAATTFSETVDFVIHQGAPSQEGPLASSPFNMVQSLYRDATLPDEAVPSDWPYITCEVKDGHALVRFSAAAASWPTSWPATATCSQVVGADTYELVFNLINDPVRPASWDGVQSCGSGLHIGASTRIITCELQLPTAGDILAAPRTAKPPPPPGHWLVWPTLIQAGTTPDPNTDWPFPGVTCQAGTDLIGQTLLTVRVSAPDPSGGALYCPYAIKQADGTYLRGQYLPVTLDPR